MRFSWSLDLNPRVPTVVVWPRRYVPPTDRASGAKQRRYAIVSPSNSSIVVQLFVVVENILNLESLPFFIRKADHPSRRIMCLG